MVKSAKAQKPRILKVVPPASEENGHDKDDNGGPVADRETFHFHLGEIEKADAFVAVARKARKEKRRLASDAGIILHDLDTVMKMREEEPETVQEGIKRLATYAYWAGLAPGVQADLFTAADKRADKEKIAEEQGYVDGLEGKTAEGERYDAANPIGQARLRGWNRGQDVVKARFIKINAEGAPAVQ